jgi:hypothetical protein
MGNSAKEIAAEMNQTNTGANKKIYLIFQGKFFYGNRTKEHGIFLVMINIKEEEIIRSNFALSTAYKLRNISYDSTNKDFIEFFKNISLKDRSQGVQIKENLEEKVKTVGVSNLLGYDQAEFESLMQETIENTVQENINLHLNYDLRSTIEMKDIYPSLFEDQGIDEAEDEPEEDIIKLECKEIIAPVQGKKMSQLEVGDIILVKLIDSRKADFNEKLKNLRVEGTDKIKGGVAAIDLTKEQGNIVVQFIEDVYGIITLDEDTVKTGVKLAVPSSQSKEDKAESDLLVNILFVLLVVIIISFYFLS